VDQMNDKQNHGPVGDGIESPNAGWNFGGHVPERFARHVRRSIPFFETGHDLVEKLSDFFIQPESVGYDLGCADGHLTRRLARRHLEKNARWVGLDKEEKMIELARREAKSQGGVSFINADLVHHDFEKSDMIVSYYCLQFVAPKFRQDVINRIYQSLNWGGAFIWFEKVRGGDARFQDILTTLYNDFKLEQNFSAEEILSKTRSLKGVLEPFSTQGNRDLLKRAGFVDVMSVMKYLCFEGFLAIK